MKKFILFVLTVLLFDPIVQAQVCTCSKVKFSITSWICKGKTATGNPVYEGKLTITNSTACKFSLTQIMQQSGGDVALALPVHIAPGGIYSNTIVYTDFPPHVAPGSTPYFIVVYSLNNNTCKFEFPSEKIPDCKTACDCDKGGWQAFDAAIHKTTQKVKCGYQFIIKTGEPVKLQGKYVCKGTCDAKYVAVLKKNVTNTVMQTYNPFLFPWTYNFPATGNYRLEITPLCGNKKCTPCVFYFTVK